MDPAPYYPPTYFAPAYFYLSPVPGTSVSSTTGLSPYNAPTYFPPSYFFGPSPVAGPTNLVPSTGLTPYNAPTYFPPSYFLGSATSTTEGVPALPEEKGCDHDAYEAIVALLKSSRVFEEVIFGAATQRSQVGADTYPLAVVTPKGWEEADDFDPVSIVRRVSFTINIVVKSQDGGSQAEKLDWLSTVVERIVNRSDLNGKCLPPLTRIRSGRYDYPTRYPEESLELEGEFSSIIDPLTDLPASN